MGENHVVSVGSCHVGPGVRSQWRNDNHWHVIWPNEQHWCYEHFHEAQERVLELARTTKNGENNGRE